MLNSKELPLVSVVMPVHNAGKYLREAMHSILTQTYTNLEFIIINDGSSDNSIDTISSFSDPRIILFSFPQKQGLSNALNKGFELSKGEYLARMDADDISLPHRLEKQIAYMQANPEVGILGTQIIAIGNKARWLPVTHKDITWHLLNACPFLHPSVVFRKSTVLEHQLLYNPEYYGAEDLELWVRASHVTQLANLKKGYVKYRYHFGMHQAMLDIVARLNTGIKLIHLNWLMPDLTDAEKKELALIMNRHITHERNPAWLEKGLIVFETVLKKYPQYANELVTEFNKCLWFHISSEPSLYKKNSSLLIQHPWFKLTVKQRAWLKIKPLLSKQAG